MEKLLIWPELVDGSGGEGRSCRCCGGGGGGLICSSTELLKVEETAAAAPLTLSSLTWEKLEYVDALRNFVFLKY